MRLCTFDIHTPLGIQHRIGSLTPGGIIDLNFAVSWYLLEQGEPKAVQLAGVLVPPDMLEFLRGEERSLQLARDASREFESVARGKSPTRGAHDEQILFSPSEVRLRAPLPNPASLRDFYAFEEHVRKGFEKRGEPMPQAWFEIPVYYKSGHENIIGPDDEALWPSFTEKFDYELEIAFVIGRRGRNIAASEAGTYIAGFTVMNDFSARDIQRKEMSVRLGPAKGKDWCTGIGPVLVTRDEIGDPYNLRMTARVNGELWSEGNTSSIHWKFEQMIEFLSRDQTIYPGDVIGSGTVGRGCGLELDRWVRPGDLIELEIEKIGVLRNRVVRPA